MMKSVAPHVLDPVLVAPLDVFVDLMARRPLPGFAEKTRAFSREDRDIIDLYCKRLGVTHARIAYLIAGRRHALKQEALGVADGASDLVAADDGTIPTSAMHPSLKRLSLTVCLDGLTLEIGDELSVRLKDGITLGVDGNQPRDELFEHHHAPGERFDFKPQFKIVIGRHDGVSSVELWAAYQAHLSGESQAGGDE